MKKMRSIEMIICSSSGDDAGTWCTDYIEIPFNTPSKNIEKVAVKATQRAMMKGGCEGVVHIGVYCVPPKEDVHCHSCLTVMDREEAFSFKKGFLCEGCAWEDKPLICTYRPHDKVAKCGKEVGVGGFIDDKNKIYLCKPCYDENCAFERDGRP